MADQKEEIGILLVHGMGEQKQYDHLDSSARELASFVAGAPGLVRYSIVSRSADSPSITLDASFHGGRRVRLHLHEVWWADLGIRGGIAEQVKFWLWGLGQWAAEVVRKGDPTRNTAQMMAMPRFGYQASSMDRPGFLRELPSRLLLFGAALLAILTFFTWSAAKQVVALLSKKLPEPSLIFLFLGDVKIYERPGGPGKGTLFDPDMPMRATIRRRMVSAMTGMAARPYDRWYVFAHSLGTIPAFNALQEMELTLPNYLSEAEWQALPERFKTQAPFTPAGAKPSTDRMMPRRPPWLGPKDGISRTALFKRFAGFVTYGSPLDKFAALWPRVVPLNRQAAVFPKTCEWVNLHDPTDPVAARLDAFAPPLEQADEETEECKPLVPHNFGCRSSLAFGLSHIRYFRPRRRNPKVMPLAIARALVSGGATTLSGAAREAELSSPESWARMLLAVVQVAALALSLSAAAAVLLIAVGKALPDRAVAVVKAAMRAVSPELLAMLEQGGRAAFCASLFIVLALALAAIVLAGAARIIADLLRAPHD